MYSTRVFGGRILAGPGASPHRWSPGLPPAPLNVAPCPPALASVPGSELPSEAARRRLFCQDRGASNGILNTSHSCVSMRRLDIEFCLVKFICKI